MHAQYVKCMRFNFTVAVESKNIQIEYIVCACVYVIFETYVNTWVIECFPNLTLPT